MKPVKHIPTATKLPGKGAKLLNDARKGQRTGSATKKNK